MKKRIADIVTEFSVEGLNKVQRAIKELARDVRESGAKSEKLDKDMASTAASAEAAAQSVDGIGDAADRASSSTQALGGHLDDAAISAKVASTSIDAVDGSARSASDSIRSSSDSMDDLSDSSRRAASETQDVAQAVERIAPATVDAVQAVDGIGDAATDAGRHIDRVASSVDQVADGLRDARTEAASVADAVPAVVPKADFEEVLSYQRRLAQARKAVAGLETSIPDASPDTVDTLRQALDAGQERIRYLETRLRDGTSERAEAAAAKAQVAAEKARADAARVAQRETARADREAKRSALAAERVRAAEERARQKAERDAKRAADREERARIAAEKRANRPRPDGIGPNGKPTPVPDPVPDVAPDLAPALADADRPASRLRTTLTQIRTVVGQVVRAIRREMPGALATTQTEGRKAFRGLRSSLSAFQSRVGAVQAQIGDLVQSVPGRLRSALVASTAALVGAIRDPVGAVRNAVAGTAHLATATLTGLAATAQRIGSTSVRSFIGLGSTIGTAFRQIGPLTQSALGAVRSGLSSIGPAATSALSRIPALAGAAGRGLRNSLLKDVRLVGSVIGGLGRAVVAGLAGIPRAIGAAGRAFAGLARAGASAFRALARAGAGVASGLVRTFAGAASGILQAMTSKITLITAALVGLGDLTVRAVKGFAPLLGLAGGVAGVVAGVVTMKDVEAVRQLSDALNLSPQIVSQWQFMGAAVGAASDDVLGAMQALGTTMTALANGDESVKPVAELFKQLGISVSTAEGRFKSVSQMMSELAVRSRHLDAETRNHLFAAIFGEADALKLSSMFKAIGDDYERLNAKMASNEVKGLLITPQQMETLAAFQAKWSELLFTLKALARELFLAFEPIFSQFIKFANLKLEMPGQRGNLIQKVFVQPFERAWKLTRDIMQAWWDFDFDAWFTGASSGGVAPENMWLYDVKKAAVDTYLVFRGLIDLIYGAVGAFVSLFRAVDDIVRRLTGFSFEGWALTDGAADFRAFAADARQVLSTLFDAPIDPSKMTTGLGQALAGSVNSLKGVVTPIWRSVVDDLLAGWTEFQAALGDDRPLASMKTWTGTILAILNDLREDLVAFGRAFWTVFIEDQPAPDQFKWLDDVKTIFVGLGTAISGVAGALRLLAPAYDLLDGVSQSLFEISGATALLLGGGLLRLGTMFGGLAASLLPAGAGAGLAALLAGIAAPLAVVALKVGLVVGAVYLLYNLLTDFTGTIDRIVGSLSKAWSFLAGKDDGDPGFIGAAAQRLGLMEEPADRVRRESDQWLADREASRERMKALADPAARTAMTQELARQETQQSTQVAQTAEIEAATVEVKATGRPIILPLPEGDVTLYASEDAADRLLRSRALTAGGTR